MVGGTDVDKAPALSGCSDWSEQCGCEFACVVCHACSMLGGMGDVRSSKVLAFLPLRRRRGDLVVLLDGVVLRRIGISSAELCSSSMDARLPMSGFPELHEEPKLWLVAEPLVVLNEEPRDLRLERVVVLRSTSSWRG